MTPALAETRAETLASAVVVTLALTHMAQVVTLDTAATIPQAREVETPDMVQEPLEATLGTATHRRAPREEILDTEQLQEVLQGALVDLLAARTTVTTIPARATRRVTLRLASSWRRLAVS